MAGEIGAVLQGLRRIVSVRESRRSALLRDVDAKLRNLMNTHTEFFTIIQSMENDISELINKSKERKGLTKISLIFDSIQKIENIYAKSAEKRENGRVQRRLIFEEARALATGPSPFVGLIRYVSDEQERYLEEFYITLISYFTTEDDRNYAYHHDLKKLLDVAHWQLYDLKNILERENTQPISPAKLEERAAMLEDAISKILRFANDCKLNLDQKWGDVAAAYARARVALMPTDGTALFPISADLEKVTALRSQAKGNRTRKL